MARDEAAERRQQRAEAEGYSSYGQKYRAEHGGYADAPQAYQAAAEVKRKAAPKVVRKSTKAGVVLSAERGDFAALMAQLKREM